MRKFTEDYEKLNNVAAIVEIKHRLWGKSSYRVDELHIINDKKRIGVRIKDSELFIYKRDVIKYKIVNDMCEIFDGERQIIIKKL